MPTVHTGVSADYSGFAPDIRNVRGEGHEALKGLAEAWAQKKPSFEAVLAHELSEFSAVKINTLSQFYKAVTGNDLEKRFNAKMSPIY